MAINIEMGIDSIRVSTLSGQRVVILKEKAAERYFAIWIGPAEADALAVKIQNVHVPRPLTHDFICSIIRTFGGKVKMAVIDRFEHDSYYAHLVVEIGHRKYEVDCRPSDAMSVALRAESPICVENSILERFAINTDQVEQFKNQKPEIFSGQGQEALRLSKEEAERSGSDYVETKHLLLAIGQPFNSRAAKVLTAIGVQQGKIRSTLESSITEVNDAGFSVNAKKAIELAINECKLLDDTQVDTAHLLLGLIKEQDGSAAKVLKSLEVTPDRVLYELLRLYKKVP